MKNKARPEEQYLDMSIQPCTYWRASARPRTPYCAHVLVSTLIAVGVACGGSAAQQPGPSGSESADSDHSYR